MSKNIITFSCDDQAAIDNYPPVPASKVIPEWYKDIPPLLSRVPGYIDHDNCGSVKKCVPVLDYLTSGYVIRNTYQTELTYTQDQQGFHTFESHSAKMHHISAQPHHQCPVSVSGKKHHYFKINQPWLIRTPPGYSSLIYQPHYFFNKDYELFPGIIDTDKHTEAVTFVGVLHAQKVVIDPGTPLVVVFPFKREDWKMEVKFEDFVKKSPFKLLLLKAFHGTYHKFIHSKKKYS